MSSQRGNVKRSRPQKHKNQNAFKNSMHDTSKRTKEINSIEVSGCCERCKEVIEWKIKYKKYKPLTIPKKCTRCQQKTVKRAYYIICDPCCKSLQLCGKCGQKKEIVLETGLSAAEQASQQSQLDQEVKMLSERQRRAYFRLQESGKLAEAAAEDVDGHKQDQHSQDEDDSDLSNDEYDEQDTDNTCDVTGHQEAALNRLEAMELEDKCNVNKTQSNDLERGQSDEASNQTETQELDS